MQLLQCFIGIYVLGLRQYYVGRYRTYLNKISQFPRKVKFSQRWYHTQKSVIEGEVPPVISK